MDASLLAEQVDPVSTTLPQYGAVGILALCGLFGMWILWKRIDRLNDEERKRHEEERQRAERLYQEERRRADRLEEKLLEQNELISSQLSGHLVRATEAMREVTIHLRTRNRDRGDH